MKKCSYCGGEYPDDVVRCLTDNELLPGGEASPSPAGEERVVQATSAPAESAAVPPVLFLTDRQMRIFELVLVCSIAFGASIIASTHTLLYGSSNYGSWGRSQYSWVVQIFYEASALGLLWYVLMRRGTSFSALGLKWSWMDIVNSILLAVVSSLAFYVAYYSFYYAGLTTTSESAASTHVGYILFNGGIFFATMLFQFINPFFEELIVRAYVMTQVKRLTNSTMMAIIFSTVLQTSYHFYQGVPVAFSHAATFMAFSIYYAKTNRITPVILAHLYADVGGTLHYLPHH